MTLMQRLVLGDRYTLVEFLGDGGMAEVYLARDNSLDRHVALKVLRERYAEDEEFVERFRREALNAAALNHPGIVQVYDRGRTEDGAFYIAMEYVPGGTLKERMKAEGSLAPREAADMTLRVADALAVAHDRGIVHRDVKPQNVLLADSGEAKVSDFGIARAASSETMTQTNAVLGTLAYMSPEQVRGERVGERPVFAGGPPLRDAHRRAPLPGRRSHRHGDEAPGRRASPSARDEPRRARRTRRPGRKVAGERSRGPLREHGLALEGSPPATRRASAACG
jgi:serine/threonine protein kinase